MNALAALSTLILFIVTFFPVHSASAYPLINQNSGLCLEVENASTSNGARVVQNTCDGSDHQDWTEVATTGGFALQSAHSGQCLDVKWALTSSGAEFIQWPCHGGNNQKFSWSGDSLQVAHSGLCVDINGASTQAGALAVQNPCNGTDSQKFSTSSTPATTTSLFKDDFENGLSQWTLSNSSRAGIGTHTANSASSSLYLRHRANTVTSTVIDADVYEATLSVWIRRGDDSFSEDPDGGEDLTLSYLNSSNQWVVLESFAGSGTSGETLSRSYTLPRAALHSALQLRFSLTNGSGSDYDYWHIDDVEIVASTESYSCDAPTTLFQDNFDSGFSQWTVTNSTYVGIGNYTANSGSSSAYLRHRASSMTSTVIDATTASEISLSAWVRRGADSFSENPDANESLQIWYLNSSNDWVLVDTLLGNGTQGEIIPRGLSLPADAVHNNLQIRFSLSGGSGSDYDYWHVDDVELTSRNCSLTADVDHFKITHDSSGVYCLAETVSVAAYDNQAAVLNSYDGTITLDTQTGAGTWNLVSGNGVLVDTTSGDGLASYTFNTSDNGTAAFSLYYPSGDSSIDIDAYDNNARDDDTEGNLVFSATGFTITASPLNNPPVVPINDPITTKVSGQAFTIAIAAYGTQPDSGECGIIESYTGNKTLAVTTSYANPSSGSIHASGGGSIAFANGQASISAQYNDVGQIALTITDSNLGISGQSNNFVVQPADFSVEVSGNPGTTDSGSGLAAAGDSFTVNVQALNALGNPTPNYGNESSPESVTLQLNSLVFPSGGNVGTLNNAGAFVKVGNTLLQNASVSWSEVGSIRLAASVADGDYLGTGNINGSASSTIGRFYPDEFTVGANSVSDACVNYTYLSQPDLAITYTLTALNSQGDVTSNYDQGLGYPVATLNYHAEFNDNAADLGSRLSVQSSTWSAGEYTLADTQALFARSSAPEAPLTSLLFGISVDDTDNRQLSSMTMNPLTSGDCITAGNCTAAELGNASFYYGRLVLGDAYGPETAVLPVKFRTEYWDGQQFVTNTVDNCTLVPRSEISFNSSPISSNDALTVDLSGGVTTGQFGLLSGTTVGFLGGDAVFSFSAPGAAISQHSFTIDTDLTSMDWLRYDWNQDGNYTNDTSLPTATISFKTYRGHDRILYWRHKN